MKNKDLSIADAKAALDFVKEIVEYNAQELRSKKIDPETNADYMEWITLQGKLNTYLLNKVSELGQ
jgi:hypothetical protein